MNQNSPWKAEPTWDPAPSSEELQEMIRSHGEREQKEASNAAVNVICFIAAFLLSGIGLLLSRYLIIPILVASISARLIGRLPNTPRVKAACDCTCFGLGVGFGLFLLFAAMSPALPR